MFSVESIVYKGFNVETPVCVGIFNLEVDCVLVFFLRVEI